MKHPGQERRRRREQLRRARRKLDERQISTEKRMDGGSPQSERDWRDLVEGRIQDAMAAGDFDNLPGEGKPLNLLRNPYLDPSLDLAYGLLKNNGFAPDWITRDKEIREELEAARARLRAAWVGSQANPTNENAWQAALAGFNETLTRLNRKIDDLNLIVPIPSCQRSRLKLADEVRHLTHE
jgi:DnaJ family protein C protein 28